MFIILLVYLQDTEGEKAEAEKEVEDAKAEASEDLAPNEENTEESPLEQVCVTNTFPYPS